LGFGMHLPENIKLNHYPLYGGLRIAEIAIYARQSFSPCAALPEGIDSASESPKVIEIN